MAKNEGGFRRRECEGRNGLSFQNEDQMDTDVDGRERAINDRCSRDGGCHERRTKDEGRGRGEVRRVQ